MLQSDHTIYEYLLAAILVIFLMNKSQIAMLITLGLVLTVGVLTTIYPQHASALTQNPFQARGSNNFGSNGAYGGFDVGKY